MNETQRAKAASLALCLWGSGCLVNEVVATSGAVLTVLVVAAGGAPQRVTLRRHGWLFAAVAWALLAPTMVGRWPTGSGAARLIDWLLLPVAVAALRSADRTWLERGVGMVAGVWMLSCGAALAQHVGFWPSAESLAPLRFTQLPFERVYELVPGRDDRFMAGGLLLHRLKFAHVGVVAVLLTAWAACVDGRRRWAWVVVTFMGAVSVWAFPHARAAAVSLALALAVLLARWRGGWRGGALSAGVLVVALLVGLGSASVEKRFRRMGADDERSQLWAAGVTAAKAHPLTGVGAGRFHPRDFASPPVSASLQAHQGKAHNQFITFAAEGGLPAALGFGLVLLLLLFRAWRAEGEGAACVALLVAVGVLAFGHDVFFHPEASMAVMLGLGVTSAAFIDPLPK